MKITDDMIDPQLLPMMEIPRLFGGTRTERGMRATEKLTRLMRFIPARDMSRESVTIPRRGSGSGLRLSIMKPLQPVSNAPGLLWLHGGGYAIGVPEMAGTGLPKKLMEQSRCVVVAPDYRLSVQAPYPAALEDAYDALVWMKDHAADLGIDDSRLIVGGESGGGGLAAALCLLARDRNEVAISFQLPLYPMMDDRMETESARFEEARVWDKESNHLAWKLYLGDLFGKEDVPPYAAAARATDFSNLPPAISFVGALELFRDETVAYFDQLRLAGVPADLEVYEGCYHAFDIMKPDADVSKRATAFVLERFRHALKTYSTPQETIVHRVW